MKPMVLSLAPLPAELVKALIMQTPDLPDFDVVSGNEMSREDLAQAFSRADVVMGDYTFKHRVSSDILTGVKAMKLIQQPSVGYQHIDVDACTARRIPVANTPGANTISVAEHTIAWGLSLLRNMYMAQQSMREGRWEQMEIKPAELAGKTWGIIGFGQIGRAVALRLKCFGLARILYSDIVRASDEVEEEYGVQFTTLKGLLGLSDVISLHAPLTDSTVNMIGSDELKALKPTAYLINVARGELVDENALAQALLEGRIAGAAVDVFSEEPVPPDNPLLRLSGQKVLLSPHVAGVSNEAAGRIINMATNNIARVLQGMEPLYVVNKI
ncbi:MAG TPA: 2-hydroxyacid dehydrogenase [Deltaproteobacteria bacterium]|nr:2-hydroxyacid dehydrogenase [Deltaproteobacteria bacterium]HRR20610.1 2-hydroxyacid dehydrogenase [Desulfomonilia bacterium]HON60833.1 2-hydroxyacid dehydrogenase [Deltaproteobacteria bacterium]HOS27114.1 2-hydroxyacid dehydrogenase [Deltaproteobacteria bacterium]HPL86706.1 2-hydroxyacid dehydrogenase [Deltaproteobacteria bacterium]